MTDTMTAAPAARTPWHLWLVGVLAVLWNGFGAYDYIMTQTENAAYLAQFTAEQRAYFASYPTWMEAVWAIGIWSSVAGSILLLLRMRWAFHAFVLSTAAYALSLVYSFVLSDGAEIMGQTGAIFSAVILAIMLFLIWYCRRMTKAGVLR